MGWTGERKAGTGAVLGVEYERAGIERRVLMGRTHTPRTNTGQVNRGAREVILGAVLGLGVVREAGMCQK